MSRRMPNGPWCRAGEKERIGRAAAALIQSGETVILDAGTTTHEIGLALVALGTQGVTVVTNNLPTALALMEAPGIEVIVIGGQVQPRRRAMLGPLATAFLAPFRADRLFLGVSGVHPDAGFTAVDFDAAQVKQAMIAHAAEVVAVADCTKIGQIAFAHVAPLAAVSLLLTDAELTPDTERILREAGLFEVRRA